MDRDHPFRARAYRRAAVPAAAALLPAGLRTGTTPVGGPAALPRQEFDTATVEKLDAALTKLMKDGKLPTGKTQAERLRTLPTGVPGISYGLGILDSGGWLGHNGEIPGYESMAAQLPAEKATLVVLVSTDIDHNGKNLSSLVGNAVTSIVTPDHLWPAPVPTAPQ